MNRNENLLWGVLAGIAVVIPVFLAISTGSPWYLLLIVVLLGLVAALRLYLGVQREGPAAPAALPGPREPETAPEPWSQETLTETELPTARPDYPMVLTARVIWQPLPQEAGEPPHADLAAVARHAVVERAAASIRDRPPVDVGVARHELPAQLGQMLPDPSGRVRAQAADVKLDLRPEDVDELRAEARRRKRGEASHQEQDHERELQNYLRKEVLTSPGRALVWWLAQHPDDIQGAVDRVGQLARLSAVAQDRDDPSAAGPQLVPTPVPQRTEYGDVAATRDLLRELRLDSADQRVFFAHALARIADESDRDDYARRLRQAFGLRDAPAPPRPDPVDEEPPPADKERSYPDDEPTTA